MNRGRPYAKRPDRAEISPVQRGINATVRVALFTGTFRELPTGYKKPQVANALPKEELHSLRRTAEYQAASFETLRESQLEELNHELDLLNQNCEQLKQTILGLKDGRKNQQNKMRAFLHSPGNAMVSREHLIKQESALSGVESQIDDWTLKLEKAQDRRFSVQQKILEHTAAVLNVRLPVSEGGARLSEEQTPPRSPERLAMGSEWESQLERERRDVESIRVYADSGVASLLRDIEQEIDLMDRSITMSP